jgi:8-oxo-dGTP pyrophosphatase MutT (NUDIX family)
MPSIAANTVQVHIYRHGAGGPEFLILHRAPSLRVHPSMWQVVTGRIDPGESAAEAGKRETREETALDLLEFRALPTTGSYYNASSDTIELISMFCALAAPASPVVISREHVAFEWLPFDAAMERLVLPSHHEGLHILRDYIIDGAHRERFRNLL